MHVVIDVGAAGVSFPDLLLMSGEYQLKLDPPFVPGTEVAGVVRSAPRLGFRAGPTGYGADHARRLGGTGGGAAGQRPRHAGRHRRRRGRRAARQLLHDVLRACQRGALRAGETVLVLGSAGGVGTAAVQIAKALGAKVIAMVHRPGAMDFVESLGADVVLPLTDGWLRRCAITPTVAASTLWWTPSAASLRRRDPGAGDRGPTAGPRLRGGRAFRPSR